MTKKEISEALEFCIKTMVKFKHDLEALEVVHDEVVERVAMCQCAARSEYECCCEGVDWKSAREKQLEAGLAAVKASHERLLAAARIAVHDESITMRSAMLLGDAINSAEVTK